MNIRVSWQCTVGVLQFDVPPRVHTYTAIANKRTMMYTKKPNVNTPEMLKYLLCTKLQSYIDPYTREKYLPV